MGRASRVHLLLALAAVWHASVAVQQVVALPQPPAVLAAAAAAAAAGVVPVAMAALEAAAAAAAADEAAAGLAGGAGARSRHLLATPKVNSAPSKRCQPTMLTLAKQLPELRQAVALAEAGYNMFAVDGGKAFTLLAPSSAALQELAAGLANGEDEQKLQDGFLSIVLYNQLPGGPYDVNQLVALQGDGMQTSLGRATKETYTVSFDNNTLPVVATGGWPSNNAQLQSSHKACDGWMHVAGTVLLPSQLGSLPRLVDDTPDLPNSVFMGLIDGSGVAPEGAEPPAAPPPADAGGDGAPDGAPPPPSHSNSTGIVVSSGDGTPSDASAADVLAGSGDGGSNNVLVVAASVAAGAVALCAAVVAGVLLRKRQLRRRRQAQHSRLEEDEEDDYQPAASKASMRPVQLHVDA